MNNTKNSVFYPLHKYLAFFSQCTRAVTMLAINRHEWQEVWEATLQCRNDDEPRHSLSVNFAAICLQLVSWQLATW